MMLLGIPLGPVPGDQAVALAKKALRDFEVPGTYRLESLGGPYENGDRSPWHLKIRAARFSYSVAVTDAGRIHYIERSDFGGSHDLKPNAGDEARVARWLRRIHPRFPTRRERTSWPNATYFFQSLLDGYPVVYPRTGLGYRIMLENGELFSFTAEEQAPKHEAPHARLSEADALKAVDRIFHAQNPPKGGWTFSYHLYDRRELGWFVPEGGGPTRLVWRVPFMFERSGQFGSQGGSSGMLIDANTGGQIRTPTVP